MNNPKLLSLLLLVTFPLHAREWVSADGRKIQADFVSATATDVKVKMAGKDLSIPLSRLSAADQAWVKEQATKPAGAGKPVEGPYAPLITGDWALSKFKDLPFALYGAKELDAAKKYPLILSLHGKSPNDENGKQVGGWTKTFTTAAHYAKNPCIVVAPLCYQPFGITGSGWSDKPGTEALALVKELMKSLPIDKDRVYASAIRWAALAPAISSMSSRVYSPPASQSRAAPDQKRQTLLKRCPYGCFMRRTMPT